MQSAITTYKEAVSELINAVNALDQAHSMLKDIGWDKCISTQNWGRHMSLLDAVAITDKLLFDAQNATCPDCCKALAESEDCLAGCCPDLVGHVNG